MPAVAKQTEQPAITPGGNKATLILGDGTAITLDSAANGALGRQGNMQVVKTGNGQLAYQSAGQSVRAEILFNTIVTPRGGKYRYYCPTEAKFG
ncbi:hypothetical protein MKQ70_26725 [Chitinophaga sedimenti]|uniref:hypothetical protein n=1 Tax=Chitinophaga sedimenti TaxID=2033606 RepID=UPI0020055A08|nr:hypothetical protein [Chitinophaga sedimenti]MCK7558397.1 hypothetical protein [Chitinophaga sedimenti]